jgi:hypothetical protein
MAPGRQATWKADASCHGEQNDEARTVSGEVGAAIREATARGEPVLVFLAGSNGAGKSTFFASYLQPLGLPFVNADEIALRLREGSLPTEAGDVDRFAFELAERSRPDVFTGMQIRSVSGHFHRTSSTHRW